MEKRILIKNKGYTIVELVVVMGIIAILLPLAWGGYNATRKQQYTKHVANTAQTSIRDAFIDVLSTKVESGGGCSSQSPQLKAVRFQLGTGLTPMSMVSFCTNSSGGGLNLSPAVKSIDPSEGINYKQELDVKCTGCDAANPLASVGAGYLYLIFTSPYGKYYSYYTSETDSDTADDQFINLGGSNVGWEKGDDLVYKPKPNRNNFERDLTMSFSDSTTGLSSKIVISKEGNVTLD